MILYHVAAPLRLIGSVTAELGVAASVLFSFQMVGTWEHAFGIKRLTISNVLAEVGVMSLAPFLYDIGAGGVISIGDRNDPNPMSGSIYFRVNLKDPSENYFFGKIVGATLGNIFSKLLGIDLPLPGFLKDIGFSLLQASYCMNPLGTTTPNEDIVPFGFYLKGVVNIFGVTATTELLFSKSELKLSFELSSFNLGFLRVSRSKAYDVFVDVSME